MNLDDELRAALRREDPSPGFAKRVTARARVSPARKSPVPWMLWAAALAAMLVVGFMGAFEYRQMKAERAGRDAVVALRITAEKLNMARDKVLRREN
jgi:hypothetical protein